MNATKTRKPKISQYFFYAKLIVTVVSFLFLIMIFILNIHLAYTSRQKIEQINTNEVKTSAYVDSLIYRRKLLYDDYGNIKGQHSYNITYTFEVNSKEIHGSDQLRFNPMKEMRGRRIVVSYSKLDPDINMVSTNKTYIGSDKGIASILFNIILLLLFLGYLAIFFYKLTTIKTNER